MKTEYQCGAFEQVKEMAFVFCATAASTAGSMAIRWHAATACHIDSASQHRDTSGVLQRPKTTQPTLELASQRNGPLNDQVTHAETLLVLHMTLKGIAYSWADTTDLYPKMFPDSEIAKKFSCKKSKTFYIVSDGLGPYFKKLAVDELNKPDALFIYLLT